MTNVKSLSYKQSRFVEEYLVDFNATQAAIRAGYSERTARVTGPENLQKGNVRAAVERRIAMLSAHSLAESQNMLQYFRDQPKNARSRSRATRGHVYFIRADNGLVKIGNSSDVRARFKAIDQASPCNLEIALLIETESYIELEALFHQRFSGKRVKGEWFGLSEEDIEAVRNEYAS
jgi:hypothetical protein